MDPVSMILALAMKNPQAVANMASTYRDPGRVDAGLLSQSAADFAMQTLTCYHPTARFRGVEILGSPWRGQAQYGAAGSVVMRIAFEGRSRASYQMTVAAMAKEQSYRTFVINETSLVPYNKKCGLELWTAGA